MVNYQKSKIYKIISTSGPLIYIGTTTKKYLSQRLDALKTQYKKYKEDKTINKNYCFILFDEYGIENCYIILLEAVIVDNIEELRAKEKEYIIKYECVNKIKITTEKNKTERKEQKKRGPKKKIETEQRDDKKNLEKEYNIILQLVGKADDNYIINKLKELNKKNICLKENTNKNEST